MTKRLARLTMVVLALTFLAPVLPRAVEAEGPPTVNIIHMGRTMTIPLMALPGHLRHGDDELCPTGGGVPPCE